MADAELGFQAQIYTDLEGLPDRIKFADRSNKGKTFSLLILWKKVEQIASKKYDALMAQTITDGVFDDPKSISTPGNHVLAESNKFSVQLNVSVPRREFNLEWFAKELNKSHKVPIAITKALYEQAKKPGESQTRKITVAEKV